MYIQLFMLIPITCVYCDITCNICITSNVLTVVDKLLIHINMYT